MSDHILQLNDIEPEARQEARLPDGKVYQLKKPEDFGPVPFRRLGLLFNAMEELMGVEGDLSDSQEASLEQTINELAGQLIIDAPESAVADIPAIKKRGLVLRFFIQAGKEVQDLIPSTSVTSLLAANDSTEETQSNG